MAIAYIGLGSNLGNRKMRLTEALQELHLFCQVRKVSRFIETKPVGNLDQPDFVNAVAEVDTEKTPQELLRCLKSAEKRMGRVPREKWGPREIDLDLLSFEDVTLREKDVEIPHPRMHERHFVLFPLSELNPHWLHPILKKTVGQLLDELPNA